MPRTKVTKDNNRLIERPAGTVRWPFFRSMQARIMRYLAILIIIVLAGVNMAEFYGVPFTAFEGQAKGRKAEILKDLSLLADLKKERLLRWFQERYNDAWLVANSPLITSGIKDVYETVPADDSRRLETREKLASILRLVKTSSAAYERIDIIDARSGTCIATTSPEQSDERAAGAELSASAATGEIRVMVKEKPGHTGFSLLITRAILMGNMPDDEKSPLPVLVCYTDPHDFIKPLLHTGGSLAKTDEVVLVDHEQRILLPLRYSIPDGTAAVPLKHRITALPARAAARGEEGIAVTADYRGVPVLASFRHLNIAPETSWGLVVKRDMSEAFAPLDTSRNYTLILGILALLAALPLLGFAARRLARPIQQMAVAARRVQAGDFTARAPVTSSSEIRILASSFNSMVERIADQKEELEEQVRKRTGQLEEANRQLRADEKQLREQAFQRDKAHGLLKEALAIWQATFDSLQDSVMVLDTDQNILNANEPTSRFLGIPAGDIIGRKSYSLLGESPGALVERLASETIKTGKRQEMEWELPRGIIALITVDPITDEKGKVTGLIHVLRDITEPAKAQQALEEAEKRFLTVFHGANDGMALTDADSMKFCLGNRSFCKMFGYAQEELNGLPVSGIHLESDLKTALERFRNQAGGQITFSKDVAVKRKNGTVFYADINSTTIILYGKTYLMEAFRDTTERRHAEEEIEKLARFASENPNPVMRSTADGLLLYANRAAGDLLLEWDLRGEQIILPGGCCDTIRGALASASSKDVEMAIGDKIYLMTFTPAVNEGYVDLYGRDVTELKTLQEQLLQSEKLAAIGELVSGTAHEINNPLTGIIGFSEMLKRNATTLSGEQKEQLDMVHSEAVRIKRIVSNFLSFARKQSPGKEQINVNNVVKAVLDIRAYQLKVDNVILTLQFGDGLPPVIGDFQQLQQVFLNIINNAHDAMVEAHKKGNLNVRTYAERGMVKIRFEDDGPGIPRQNIIKIFDPFFTTKTVGKGTGLGLSVSYGIVKRHNGNIHVESREGRGTAFTVELPAKEVGHERGNRPCSG